VDGREEAERVMEAMGGGVLRHLIWRFRKWYEDGELLSNVAGPILGELMGQVLDVAHGDGDAGEEMRRPPLVVYSCHDVTILGLLYGIGADFVASDDQLVEAGIDEDFTCSEQRWQVWPEYASTLLFELVRVREEGGEGDGTTKEGSDCSHVVRVVLNGKPVRVMASLNNNKKNTMTTVDGPTNNSDSTTIDSYDIPLSTFSRVIKELQSQGDLNFDARGGSKRKREKGKNDMSNWTG